MKKSYLLIAFLAVARIGWAQGGSCNLPCCQQEFPYEFCDPTDGTIFVKCSTNPNADGNAVKQFIPSCVNVDQMPDNVLWQPNGPPPQPGALIPIDQLNNNSDEESGASDQQVSDRQLFIGGAPPVDPSTEPNLFPVTSNPGDEPTCGDEPKNTCGDDPCGAEPYPNNYSGGVNDPQYIADEAAWNACEDGSDGTTDHATWQACIDQYHSDHADWVTCEETIDQRIAQW